MGCLLFSFYLFYHIAVVQIPRPRVMQKSNAVLYEKLASGFDATQLFRLYRANLRLRRVMRNRHEPTMKDSILYVATAADQLELLRNRFTTLLYSATITSGKVGFAGMRVGVSKEQFCRTLHLNPAYDVYIITDGMENFVQLRFTFVSGKLKSAQFKPLINLDAID
jgi:hypothetical protein